jgi:hypothetical protein
MKNPIMKVAEMIAENFITATFDFRSPTCTGQYVWDPSLSSEAITSIEPALGILSKHIQDVCQANKISKDLIEDTRRKEAQAGYKIGVITGLYLAGRVDLLPKVAAIYAERTDPNDIQKYLQYTDRGKRME